MLTRIFCNVDGFFARPLNLESHRFLLETECKKRMVPCQLGLSEVMAIVISFGNQMCGYGCVKDQYNPVKIFCGEKSGDNCAIDPMGNIQCGKNCVATGMSSIACDKERYSGSSAHP